MEQQAGILKVVLYEDKNLSYQYYDANTIVDLATDGDMFTFDNTYLPQIDITPVYSENNTMFSNYGARLTLDDFNETTLGYLQSIYESCYGWKMLVYFYDGTIKFLDEVLKMDNTAFKINESMTFLLELLSIGPTDKRFITYDPDTHMSEYKADTNVITADDTTITADYY